MVLVLGPGNVEGLGSGWERRGAPGVGGQERCSSAGATGVLGRGVLGSGASGRGAVPGLFNAF